MKRYAIGVVVLAVTGSVYAQAVQWTEAEGGNGHWYEVSSELHHSQEASVDALGRGGYLACFESPEEHAWLIQWAPDFPSHYSAWIGLLKTDQLPDPTSGWHWYTGVPASLDWGWGPNEPADAPNIDEWCGAVNRRDNPYLFFDAACSGMLRNSVIEWSADCNGDGIVDYGQILDGTFEDADGNGVPDCCDDDEPCFPCPADIVGNDGVVDIDDLLFVIATYGEKGGLADLDGNGVVDVHDILLILKYWGDCP